jgi:hypothetical protein
MQLTLGLHRKCSFLHLKENFAKQNFREIEYTCRESTKFHNAMFHLCRFWIIGDLGAWTVIGYQSIREDNAITGGINRLV